ncbi:HAMP domain-containing sensor histidine kinase [Pseudonocardia ailaonensis]|uniref:sensor histidine kinase n=1 Tax=Pseudonocardia ailaonensis TaxID=367279 RepID=UPI0031CF55D5
MGRLQRARFTSRLTVDLCAIAALCAGVVVLASTPRILDWLHRETASDVLTIAAAGVGAAAAILALVGSRVLGDARLAWLAAALVLYCAVVLPWGVTAPAATATTAEQVSRFVAYATALVLLVFALRPPRRLGGWGGWVIMVGGVVLAVLALFAVPQLGPVTNVLTGPVSTVIVVVGWVAAAVLGVVEAARRQSGARLRAGLGLVVLAAGQLYRLSSSAAPVGDLVFPALRLVGLSVLFVGLLQMVQRGLRNLQEENFAQQEELAVAALHMERAAANTAERNHELRNGLAGLAGITHLLSAEGEGPEHARLRKAVLAELGRLHTILESRDDLGEIEGELALFDRDEDGRAARPAADPGSEGAGYLVAPMLEGLVALRQAREQEVSLQVPEDLETAGDSAVAAQIVTNLLANCERHAPGTRIDVSAFAAGGRVVIEVRDHGPGLPEGREGQVFDRGARDAGAGGEGLGLHISRQLAEGQGGSLELRSATEPRGCIARLTLPAADSHLPATDSIAR